MAAVAPLALTPGASFALTVSHAPQGAAAVWRIIVGTGLGILTHSILAAVGLAAVVMRSAEMYRAIQFGGALYLAILGASMLRPACRGDDVSPLEGPVSLVQSPAQRLLKTAYLANVLNPKAAGVYLSLAPQFIVSREMGIVPMMTLATMRIALMGAWLLSVSLALGAVGRRARIERLLDVLRRLGGVLLIALGLRSAIESADLAGVAAAMQPPVGSRLIRP